MQTRTFFLRGDTCHTTDPFSGTGCKTAIEETLADQYFFHHGELASLSEMERSILAWGHDYYQQKMFDKAFEERFDYYTGTERLTRFVDLAQKAGCMSEQECADYLCITDRRKAKGTFSAQELQFSQAIEKRLQTRLDKERTLPQSLSSREKAIFCKIRHNPFLPLRGKKALLAKLCLLGQEEGWLLTLLEQNRRNIAAITCGA